MDHLISRSDAIKAMLNEQKDDIKAYGCPIPECFDCVTDVEFFCAKGERITDETN